MRQTHSQPPHRAQIQPMVRLAYQSRARVALKGPEFGALNAASQRNNARGQVGGILLCNQGQFFGVIEGARTAVEACFQRIARDRMHGDIQVLTSKLIRQRAFDWWRMGVATPEAVPMTTRFGIFSLSDVLPPDSPLRGNDPEVRALVRKYLASFAILTPQPLQKVG